MWLKSWRTISYKKSIEIIFSVFLDIAFIRNLCNSKKSKKNRTSYHRLYIQSSKSMQDLSAWFEFSLIYITKPAGKIRALRRSSLFITHYVAVRCLSHPSFYFVMEFFILFLWVFPFVGSFRFYFFREFFILFWLFSSVVSFLFCCKSLLLLRIFSFAVSFCFYYEFFVLMWVFFFFWSCVSFCFCFESFILLWDFAFNVSF